MPCVMCEECRQGNFVVCLLVFHIVYTQAKGLVVRLCCNVDDARMVAFMRYAGGTLQGFLFAASAQHEDGVSVALNK